MTYTTIDSPIGPLTLVRDDAGLTGVYMPGHRPAPDEATFGERDDTAFADAVEQFGEYWSGERTRFTLPLSPAGTEFQQRVWQALREVPYGETRTYRWIAETIGQPTAVRAVGLANSRNPLSIVVPCHRVVGASGALTGYAGGVERKRFLLDHESGAALAVDAADASGATDASGASGAADGLDSGA